MSYDELILFNALESIIWYNGHYRWLTKLVKILESDNIEGNISCPDFCKERDTEVHFIWMLLVGVFGDWGTSINSGWIDRDKRKEAAQFIRELCAESWKAEEWM